jgi:hypothetical protein
MVKRKSVSLFFCHTTYMGHTHRRASAAVAASHCHALLCNGLACITLTKKVCVRGGKHHESRTTKVPLKLLSTSGS